MEMIRRRKDSPIAGALRRSTRRELCGKRIGVRNRGKSGRCCAERGCIPPNWSSGGNNPGRGRIGRCGMIIGAGNGNAVRWKRKTNSCATRWPAWNAV